MRQPFVTGRPVEHSLFELGRLESSVSIATFVVASILLVKAIRGSIDERYELAV
jgi:hypothetical protein